jgi:predicted TIM-barrel fold metal-dependent hydrolase
MWNTSKRSGKVFQAANKLRLPMIVHVRGDQTYGAEHAKVFIDQLVAAAPDVPVQVAHLWGGESFSDAALGVFAEAVAAGDPHARNLYFDVAQLALVARGSQEVLQTCARRMRQIGLKRILFASDGPEFGNVQPREAWRQFRKDVPLTDEEFRIIANNVAPYFSKSN